MHVIREQIMLRADESFRLLRWDRSVSSVQLVLGRDRTKSVKGQGDHWHYHPALELTLVQNGSGTRLVADDIDLFESGDLVLLGPNVPHYWHMRGSSKGLAIQWDFPNEHGIWSFPESSELRPLIERSQHGVHILGATNAQIRERMERMVHADGLTRLGIFLEILGTLRNASNRDTVLFSKQQYSLNTPAETQEIIRRAVSYVLAHYREPIHLNELLRLTGMSRATFARQFLHHVGKSFSTFRNQVRLQAVCHALRHSSDAIGSIAFDHGFSQLSFFNRLFQREFGISPSDYRKRHRESKT